MSTCTNIQVFPLKRSFKLSILSISSPPSTPPPLLRLRFKHEREHTPSQAKEVFTPEPFPEGSQLPYNRSHQSLYELEGAIPVRQNAPADDLADSHGHNSNIEIANLFDSRIDPTMDREELVDPPSDYKDPRRKQTMRMRTGGKRPTLDLSFPPSFAVLEFLDAVLYLYRAFCHAFCRGQRDFPAFTGAMITHVDAGHVDAGQVDAGHVEAAMVGAKRLASTLRLFNPEMYDQLVALSFASSEQHRRLHHSFSCQPL
ncbi:hypothetical protein Q7P36_002182 [Cladosporium allicinum]